MPSGDRDSAPRLDVKAWLFPQLLAIARRWLAECLVCNVVTDTGSWEQKLAQTLESMPEVRAYVKNQGLNFSIPCTVNDDERQYHPDFIVSLDGGLTLVIEVSAEERKDKAAKVATGMTLWVPAVNNHGRWAFMEITDPWNAKGRIWQAIEGAMVL